MKAANPTRSVHHAFERIHRERMVGLPILNDALQVDVVGFIGLQERWIGVLITPWCLNLMVLPMNDDGWQPPAEGVWRHETFPGQAFQLLGGVEEEVGSYAFRSLASPVTGYPNHEAVRDIARELLKQLLIPAPETPTATHDAESELITGAQPAPRQVSRRHLFGGS